MRLLSRRQTFSILGACALGPPGLLGPGLTDIARAAVPDRPKIRDHAPFRFLFITDTHIEPELGAQAGCVACFRRARTFRHDFVIQGGDHVFDAAAAVRRRAMLLMDMYHKAEDDIGSKVYHTIGNHDLYGVVTRSGASPTDPLYGKKYFEDNFGKRFYSFDHKGVHFAVLDSIGVETDTTFVGRISDDQIEWLKRDLAAMPVGQPVIVVTHVPFVTALLDYKAPRNGPVRNVFRVVNAYSLIDLFDGYNVLAVLQGHTHILEHVTWHGVQYITGGAVCGNWWHGTQYGTPEGFLVVDVAGGEVTTTYQSYGFKSIDPRNT